MASSSAASGTQGPDHDPVHQPDAEPDLMNDPAFAVNASDALRGPDDVDTCRICRGEGTRMEPLFYPCKCSGSIKFVHQNCLMEWLSHSQKKHCELCKTPFRFTKLYHANMPKTLPTAIFIRRALLHLLSHLTIWLRGLLVFSAWVVCLPWCMRYAWRILFWFGDAGWARDYTLPSPFNGSGILAPSATEALPLPVSNVTNVTVPKLLQIHSQTLNLSHTEPMMYRFVKTIITHLAEHFKRLDFPESPNSNSTTSQSFVDMAHQRQSSILSEVPLLKSLTRSVTFNRVVIDILEGLIITLSVVVAFILIFLIREWVVQQQPVADMAAGDADHALAQAGGQVHDSDEEGDVSDDDGGESGSEEDDSDSSTEHSDASQPAEENAPHDSEMDSIAAQAPSTADRSSPKPSEWTSTDSSPPSPRPSMPARDVSSKATEIRRELDEMLEEGREALEDDRHQLREARTEYEAIREEMIKQLDEEIEIANLRARDDRSEAEGEQFSTNSTESWQSVADPSTEFYEPATREGQQECQRDPQGKGKSPVYYPLDESSRLEHGESSGQPVVLQSDDRQETSPRGTVEEEHVDVNDEIALHIQRAAENSASEQAAEPVTPTVQGPPVNRPLFERLADWFWGDIAPEPAIGLPADGENDGHIVENPENEAPFVPFAQARPILARDQRPELAQEPQAEAFAAQPALEGNDQDAIDDAEDLEGILELIGMQGPITGLLQYVLFSAVLIFASVVAAVFFPYISGKIVLICVGSPALLYRVPLVLASTLADATIDTLLIIGGYVTFGFLELLRYASTKLPVAAISNQASESVAIPAKNEATAALYRLGKLFYATTTADPMDFLRFSMACHQSLRWMKSGLKSGIYLLAENVVSLTGGSIATWESLATGFTQRLSTISATLFDDVPAFLIKLFTTGAVSINMSPRIELQQDPSLAYWSAGDRTLTVILGYTCFAILGIVYLTKLAPLTSSRSGQQVEGVIVDLLQQAGGVLKVILIISIEMIAFPLFCGLLLDLALMPLFEGATVASRISFTIASPWTSGFVHWFVGTCYMFHFALFVSMCRRIMRTGVLYFIRDPDDPTFHPVRDVLERNVIIQLRKIAFSAIVYGALIVVCLGGVVWGLWYSCEGLLPIHWSSSESAFEFPLDILFFNFLTPVILRFAQPTDGLRAMYKWWFRKCARALRLSDFLFGIKRKDERGHNVRLTWKAWILHQNGNVDNPTGAIPEERNHEVYFVPDGKFVRAPFSDQLRIPKGQPVFVEVDKKNHRLDGKPDDEGTHARNSKLITMVYIPPWFRVRIGLFVLAVWLFAAATGISVTIVPLLFGRKLLTAFVTHTTDVNDIYAFSLGIYVLGGTLFVGLRYKSLLRFFQRTLWSRSVSPSRALTATVSYAKRVASVVYVYSALGIGLPLLLAVLLELYVLMPIHAAFGPDETHIIHIIQDWTLGILYVRIGTRLFLWNPESRAGRAAQAVVRDGYLNPSAKLATRCFILPSLLAFSVLVGGPYLGASLLNTTYFSGAPSEEKVRIMRWAHPFALGIVLALWIGVVTGAATERWRQRIKDEVYLIGERLHNFGEKRASSAAQPAQLKLSM
ncbi:hypothetical protein EJ06DRAFT_532394 [Trichodelitschia bisporula]|uniref:RING-type E3 ubiquitin transferase n=1 Tax=Trichodelitschia bisporula TaxID=703511 RepID=A0A6G1HPP2_9PEZI|nr:hypothetical protein EJ06DRAFT_532394 [Trichodelitschia bisporula]